MVVVPRAVVGQFESFKNFKLTAAWRRIADAGIQRGEG
jgi:hypothetical protein